MASGAQNHEIQQFACADAGSSCHSLVPRGGEAHCEAKDDSHDLPIAYFFLTMMRSGVPVKR